MIGELEIVPERNIIAIHERGNRKISGDLEVAVNSLMVRESALPPFLKRRKEKMGQMKLDVVTTVPGSGYARLEIPKDLMYVQEEYMSHRDYLAATRFELAFLRGEDLSQVDEEIKREFPVW